MLKSAALTLLLFCISVGGTIPALAQNGGKEAAENFYSAPDTAALEQKFSSLGYTHRLPLKTYQIPPVFLQKFPSDWAAQSDEKQRNDLFIRALAPLALKLNQELTTQRAEVLQLSQNFAKAGKLSKQDNKKLEALAKKYDIFTRLKGKLRQEYLLDELSLKLDNIPPSLLIAAAAIATDWGTSRAALRGNALYKEYAWHSKEGLIPDNRALGEDYRIKTYPNLYVSMQDFAHKVNSNINFAGFRSQRQALRRNKSSLDGRSMAHNFIFDTHLQNYAGLLDYTITFYELQILDKSTLAKNEKKQSKAKEKGTKNSNNDKNCNKTVIVFLDKNKLLCN